MENKKESEMNEELSFIFGSLSQNNRTKFLIVARHFSNLANKRIFGEGVVSIKIEKGSFQEVTKTCKETEK